MLHACGLKRIGTRLHVGYLHPLRAENIHFFNISELLLFYRVFPVRILGADGYPPLSFGDHLHHCLGCSIRLLVLHATIFRIIHQSEVGGHILLVPKDLSATLLSWHLVHLTLLIVPCFSSNEA
jgi:hypothetical protein